MMKRPCWNDFSLRFSMCCSWYVNIFRLLLIFLRMFMKNFECHYHMSWRYVSLWIYFASTQSSFQDSSHGARCLATGILRGRSYFADLRMTFCQNFFLQYWLRNELEVGLGLGLELVFGIGLVLVKSLLCYVLSLWGQRNNLFRIKTLFLTKLFFPFTGERGRRQHVLLGHPPPWIDKFTFSQLT
jgi:hypothetical protein